MSKKPSKNKQQVTDAEKVAELEAKVAELEAQVAQAPSAGSNEVGEPSKSEEANPSGKKGEPGTADRLKNALIGTKDGAVIPDEPVLLSVDEDRTRLLLQGLGLLLLVILMLFLAVVFWGVANTTGNVVFLILIIAALTVVWFVSKRMGKFLTKFFKRVGLVDFLDKHVVIYPTSDIKDAIVVTYKEIRNYKLIRQGKATRLLLGGNWVKHPSGVYLIDINRPFKASTLDDVETQIKQIMKDHKVNERK